MTVTIAYFVKKKGGHAFRLFIISVIAQIQF